MRLDVIRTAVQDKFKLNIKRKTRRAIYVTARTIYFKLSREFTTKSYDSIGDTLNKNHATVMHAMKIYDCWVFCKDTKNINKYKSIKTRLINNPPPEKYKKPNPCALQGLERWWRQKYFKEIGFKRYKRALINRNLRPKFYQE